MKSDELVFVGIRGTAIALNRASGDIVWETNLKGSEFVNLVLEGENLYATTRGELFCLDAVTGEIRWSNGLRGYGWGLASIAIRNGTDCGNRVLMAAEEQLRAEQAAHAHAAAPAASS